MYMKPEKRPATPLQPPVVEPEEMIFTLDL